jgi:hypothetical protein
MSVLRAALFAVLSAFGASSLAAGTHSSTGDELNLESRVNAVRTALIERKENPPSDNTGPPARIFQWGNWGNWNNWPNWGNWNNWPNWRNY